MSEKLVTVQQFPDDPAADLAVLLARLPVEINGLRREFQAPPDAPVSIPDITLPGPVPCVVALSSARADRLELQLRAPADDQLTEQLLYEDGQLFRIRGEQQRPVEPNLDGIDAAVLMLRALFVACYSRPRKQGD